MPQNFPKSKRLLSVKDFANLRIASKSFNQSLCRIYAKRNELVGNPTRVGFSVSKKVGNAVERNRIKRLCREFFRNSNFCELGLDALLIISPKFKKNGDEQLLMKSVENNFIEMAKYYA